MNNIDDITSAIKSLSENQTKAAELQTAYVTNLTQQVEAGVTELAEQTRSHLEAVTKADSFSNAFAANVAFEDSVKSKVTSFYQKNADTAKNLMDDIAKLYGLAPEAAAPKASKKVAKTATSKAA